MLLVLPVLRVVVFECEHVFNFNDLQSFGHIFVIGRGRLSVELKHLLEVVECEGDPLDVFEFVGRQCVPGLDLVLDEFLERPLEPLDRAYFH